MLQLIRRSVGIRFFGLGWSWNPRWDLWSRYGRQRRRQATSS